MSRICMIGTGYVGLVSGACLADFGHNVVCVDIDEKRIAQVRKGDIPIYEPGLSDIVERNMKSGRIDFTTTLGDSVSESDVVFITVGTPSLADGATDLSYVTTAAAELAAHINGYTVIVQKSTVPVGPARRLSGVIAEAAPKGAEFVEMLLSVIVIAPT